MASYGNPLHPPLSCTQYSAHTSISVALVPPAHTFLVLYRRWVPQPAYTPASKWKSGTAVQPNKQLPTVSFDYTGQPRQGIPMRELSVRNMSTLSNILQGANEPVLAQTGLQKITLRILWPGYPHVDWARTIELISNGPITRAQLATAIATNYSRFMEIARTATPTNPDYAIGPSAIQFEHLVLVGLHHAFEDIWQADVATDRR